MVSCGQFDSCKKIHVYAVSRISGFLSSRPKNMFVGRGPWWIKIHFAAIEQMTRQEPLAICG